MNEVRTLQCHPLTSNRPGQGSLPLGPRERKSTARRCLPAESKADGKRGLVRSTDLAGGEEPEPEKPTATDDTAADEAKTTSKRRK